MIAASREQGAPPPLVAGPGNARILLIEDDAAIRKFVTEFLGMHGFTVSTADSAAQARAAVGRERFSLILLDLVLPDCDGIDLLRELRAQVDLPILIISGRSDEIDRVLGLELGADDYITKPFGARELLARIRSSLRRASGGRLAPPAPGPREAVRALRGYRFDGWTLDHETRVLTDPQGESVTLTSGEFNLLVAFLSMANRVVTREQLITATRLHSDIYDRSIDVQVARLRRRLNDDSLAPKMIKTERGVGYRFVATVEAVDSPD